MKKLYVLLTLGVLVFGMTACGKGAGDSNQTTEQTVETDEQTVETDEQTVETDEQTVETDEQTMETGEQTGTEDVATGWSQEMSTIRQAVVDVLGENYWPNMQIDPATLEGFYGITPDMYDDYMAEMPMISTNVDTLLIIKAKDDRVEAVETALNSYRDMLVGDTMQYPTNLGKIQASRVQTYGNYVCFVQLGADNLADEDMTEEESITKCREQNDLALEAISKNVPQE